MNGVNLTMAAAAIELLMAVRPEAQLLALQNLCVQNGGTWDPRIGQPSVKQPCLYEVSVFGVFAMAQEPSDLPSNWMRAGKNMIGSDPTDEGLAA